MSMTAKVEGYCLQHSFRCKGIQVDGAARACINCIWYEQYFHQNRGNIKAWVPTDMGFCLLREQRRGPLRQPCKDFEQP
ncbi:MAG: hypothetical protein HFG05_13040 [Oscillibacter sp.]|nr:hypothetical protein [Oscillibacter sp.]